MEEQLIQLGLSAKDAAIYLMLLEQPRQTAADIASAMREKRTNVYMLLDSLESMKLIEVDELKPVREYSAANPTALQKLLQKRLEQEQHAAATLQKALPSLQSMYALSTDKPGVVHMAGIDGFTTLLDDMIRSHTDVLLVASNDAPTKLHELELLRKRLVERQNAGVNTRALFQNDGQQHEFKRIFEERGIELRCTSDQPFACEVAIYDNTVTFTVYRPTIVITVIADDLIAGTMRTLFEQVWNSAR